MRSRRNSAEVIDTESKVNYKDEEEQSIDDLRSSVQSLQNNKK